MPRKTIIVVASVVLIVFAWSWLAKREHAALTPSSNDIGFSEFVLEMPPPKHLSVGQLANGETRIVWYGEIADMTIPSGASCYIFDGSGILLEWSASTGDGESIGQTLRKLQGSEPATMEDVKQLLNAG